MSEEMWKPVVGYEGRYEVSNVGNVKTLVRKGKAYGRNMTQALTMSGYPSVHLTKDGKSKWSVVHRLVARAFIENPLSKSTVNHKNGIKTDNRVENLEWNTMQENIEHALSTGLMKVTEEMCRRISAAGKMRGIKVVCVNENGEIVNQWDSVNAASRHYGMSRELIRDRIRRDVKINGLRWLHADSHVLQSTIDSIKE